METIHEATKRHGQSISFQRIIRTDALKLRVKLHWDRAYSFQSHGKVEVWSGIEDGWNEVYSLTPDEIGSSRVGYGTAELESKHAILLGYVAEGAIDHALEILS